MLRPREGTFVAIGGIIHGLGDACDTGIDGERAARRDGAGSPPAMDPVLLAAMIAYGASLADEAGSSWTVAATTQDAWRTLRLQAHSALSPVQTSMYIILLEI